MTAHVPVHLQPPLDEKILFGLAKIGQAIRSQERKRSFEERLSPTQAQALVLISQGVRRPSEIAGRLGVSRASLSDSLSFLAEKGLTRKRSDPRDSRSTILELTAKGKKRSTAMAEWPSALLDSVSGLSALEKATLLRTVSKMIVALQERGLISVPRMCATCRFFRPNAHPGADGRHHCAYVDAPFVDAELKLDCPEHELEKRVK